MVEEGIITSPAVEIFAPKEDFVIGTAPICPALCCISHLWNWREEEGESGPHSKELQESLLLPCAILQAQAPQHSWGKGAWLCPWAQPSSLRGGMPGQTGPGSGMWREAAARKEQAPGGIRGSPHSQGIASSCLAGWKPEALPMSHFLPCSEEFTLLHCIRTAPDPLSDLFSCLEIMLHTSNLANGSRWNGAMLLEL